MDDEELEDEDLLDEMDDEELGDEESELDDEEEGAEDDEDDSEEDEETNEGPIKPVVSQNAAKKTNGVTPVAKPETKSILKKSDTPAKAAATSKKEPVAASKKEAAASKKEPAVPERKGEKRKAPSDNESSQTLHSTKQPRLNDQTSILSEEERRREERNKKSLFVKGVGKSMKASDLKGLHPDVVDVRVVSSHAWLIFPSEAACAKAHKALSAKKVNGKPLVVDFCGSKSQNKPQSGGAKYEPIVLWTHFELFFLELITIPQQRICNLSSLIQRASKYGNDQTIQRPWPLLHLPPKLTHVPHSKMVNH